MDFMNNVVSKSNALINKTTTQLNNPFGSKQAAASQDDIDQQPPPDACSGQQSGPSSSGANQPVASSSDNTPTTTQHTNLTAVGQQDDDQDPNKNNSQFAAIAADAEAVAQKAAQGAKTFGTFLFSMANKAGQHVSQTANKVKQAVESTSFLTDFTREQQEFIREHGGSMQAGDLPWTDCNDENRLNDLRDQVLSLSQDRRNFVRCPPNDANFEFDPQINYPIALSLLKEDPNLYKMRYELVPKLVNEETFWRNYFYRVSVLRQLSEKGEHIKRGWSSSRSSSGEGPDEDVANDEPSSPSYTTASQATLGGAKQLRQQHSTQSQKQESYSAGSNTTNTNYQPTTTKTDELPPPPPPPISLTTTDYQVEDFEFNESMRHVAEADDLKNKLRELNLGSLDDQDG